MASRDAARFYGPWIRQTEPSVLSRNSADTQRSSSPLAALPRLEVSRCGISGDTPSARRLAIDDDASLIVGVLPTQTTSPRRDADGTTRSLNVLQLESLGSTPPDWARVQVVRIAGVRQEIAGVQKLKRGASNGDGTC